ncbi:MAG: hypothetical protein AAB914_04550 [Patescibacteria group bacterium]
MSGKESYRIKFEFGERTQQKDSQSVVGFVINRALKDDDPGIIDYCMQYAMKGTPDHPARNIVVTSTGEDGTQGTFTSDESSLNGDNPEAMEELKKFLANGFEMALDTFGMLPRPQIFFDEEEYKETPPQGFAD